MAETPQQVPDFFLHDVRYDVGSLVVTLAVEGVPHFEVQFDPPRAFRSYAESDFWAYLQAFEGQPLITTQDGGTGVFMSENAPVRRQMFWDSRGADLVESWPCLGSIFRRRFCGAASADVGG
uniref:hypothetical protein n=1 Tax=Brevundimonas sp. DC300-4 TaxID=2804594 RepID=UPI003CEF1180